MYPGFTLGAGVLIRGYAALYYGPLAATGLRETGDGFFLTRARRRVKHERSVESNPPAAARGQCASTRARGGSWRPGTTARGMGPGARAGFHLAGQGYISAGSRGRWNWNFCHPDGFVRKRGIAPQWDTLAGTAEACCSITHPSGCRWRLPLNRSQLQVAMAAVRRVWHRRRFDPEASGGASSTVAVG